MPTPYRPPHARHEETRNLTIALILSIIVLGGWQYFYELPRRQQEAAYRQQQVEKQQPATPSAAPAPGALPAQTPASDTPMTRTEALAAGERIPFETPEMTGTLAISGGRIDDLTLKGYKETINPDSPNVVLLAPSATKAGYFAETGWASSDTVVPGANAGWTKQGGKLTPETPVSLSWTNPDGVKFETTYAVDPHFLFTITQRVTNTSGKPATLASYALVNREIDNESQHFAILHEGPLGVLNGTLEEMSYKELREDGTRVVEHAGAGWFGITDKYWLAALIPDRKADVTARFRWLSESGRQRYQTDYTTAPATLAPGASNEVTTRLFTGAKRVDLLESYAKQFDIPLFDRAVDFGRLYFLTRPIFHLLHWFHDLVGNFGVAILILTVLIKALLFPLANKSFVSMAQMKNLVPEMNALKEKYADDRLKMNTEVIALYKREKVNPASGCLPMLVQIPVFWALYKVLFITIEMRHAPFFGWIRDLSAPDPTNLFTLFGLVPWSTHIFSFNLHVGIWPIIMAVTMLIQQKLNPKPTDPTQAIIMGVMPWMFLFMFSSFPAGLVIYWAWSNTLSILQQWFITRRFAKKHPPAMVAA